MKHSLLILWSLCILVLSSYLAWQTLALFDFGYPIWFDWLNIHDFILKFGPENRFKDNFELLAPQEYFRIFHEITAAINNQGVGLAAINYQSPNSLADIQVLRQAEILHLQDVAQLINIFFYTALTSAGIAITVQLVLMRKKQFLPQIGAHIAAPWLIIACFAGLVFMLAPLEFFYWLHDAWFPPNHQWFFYYQESLMTTLMKAPDIFGYIALALIITTLVWYLILFIVNIHFFRSFNGVRHKA